MNKQKFIELVENPASIREKDSDILAELARNYPYSSLVHILLAKASRNSENGRNNLANAALYIPDRAVLKSVMENELVPVSPANSSAPNENKAGEAFRTAPVATSEMEPVQNKTETSPNTEADHHQENLLSGEEPLAGNALAEQEMAVKKDVFDELQENLQRLKAQRDQFNNSEEAIFNAEAESIPHSSPENMLPPSPAEADSIKSYRLPERLQELVETIEEKPIEDPKRKEQINLIDNFIRNSASISRKYRTVEPPENQPDLTGTNHFTPPDLVTENLAQIMVRQGKTEKAIDIYEKLVLKYPQKKAYFASCIEKLKNS